MIYEVEFTCKSREAARATAKQLINEHVLASASITPCDYLGIDLSKAEVEEQYLVKVKALTTAPKYLIEHYSLKNFVAKAVSVDGQTAKKVSEWCNEGYEVPNKPFDTWRNMRERILNEQSSEEADNILVVAHPGIGVGFRQTAHSIGVPAEHTHHETVGEVPQEIIDASMVNSEHAGSHYYPIAEGCQHMTEKIADTITPNAVVFGNPGAGIGFGQKLDIVSGNTGTTSQERQVEAETATDEGEDGDKKRSKLPKWAEEEGLTLAEYKKRCNERTAARWGITYQEYSKLATEARKNERPLKEYFEEQGLCYSEDLSEPEDEFDDGTEQCHKARELRDAEHAFDSWLLSVGLPLGCTVNTVYAAWCDKYGLTENQRIIMTNRDNPNESTFKTKLPQWAEKLGLTIPQYKLITRIGVAAQWGATLREYDDCYNSSKENGTTIENELAARFAKRSEKNLARHIATEYRQLMNHITKLLNLYLEESDEQKSLSDDEHNDLT